MRRIYEASAVRKELERIKRAGKRRNECKHDNHTVYGGM